MITSILGLFVLILIIFYILAGVYIFPKIVYETITNPVENPSSEFILYICVFIIILVVLMIIAYLSSKDPYLIDIKSIIKKYLLMSFPIFYGSILLLSFLLKDYKTFNIMLLKADEGLFSNILDIFLFHSACSCYPVIISSITYKILADKQLKKEWAKEYALEYEEKKRQQEKEKANQEIEYYKKINELEKLLNEKTITQEKFNELKCSLDNQYNIK